MSTITKERVAGIANGEKCYTHDDVVELARIALASLEAEPAGVVRHIELRGPEHPAGIHVSLYSRLDDGIELYTAPPAPVSVPDAIEPTVEAVKRILPTSNPDDYAACIGADMWNACRAAMLQGADGALTNEDTKKMDELVMWIKRLAHSLRKASPDSKLQSDAMDYLSRKGLIGVKDILR